MIDELKSRLKKKIMKKILAFIAPALPFILGGLVIATGLMAVASFFTNLFSGSNPDENFPAVNIDAMSLEELIEASKDPQIFTEDALDEMMIRRETLTGILENVYEYNTTYVSKTKKVEYRREYIETEIVTDEMGYPMFDEDGNIMTVNVPKVEYGWMDYPVSTKEMEGAYKIDWQPVYCAAVFKKLEDYQNDIEEDPDAEPNIIRLYMSAGSIDSLVSDFEPKFHYYFDVVRDSRNKYSYIESQGLPNDGMKTDGGDPNTAAGKKTWYEPKSLLDTIELPYLDKVFVHDTKKVSEVIDYLNMSRWTSIITKYWPNYDPSWFGDMICELPGGDDVYNLFMFKYGAELENYDPESYSFSMYDASGNYEPLENVEPSINIPSNAGGMSIPLYLQYDSRWGQLSPVGSGTLASSGCGIVSLSMVLSYLEGQTIYPPDVYAWCGNRYYDGSSGQSWSLITDVGKQWGYQVKAQAVDADQIVAELSKGHPVIVSTSGYGTTQYFTGAGHFIVLRGLTEDGKVLVNDPNDNVYSKKHYSKAYDPEFIESECRSNGNLKMMWSFYK